MLNSFEENSWQKQYEFVQKTSYKRAVDLYAHYEASNRLLGNLDKFFPEYYILEAVHFGRNLNKDPFEIVNDLENAVQEKIKERKTRAKEIQKCLETGKVPAFLLKKEVY